MKKLYFIGYICLSVMLTGCYLMPEEEEAVEPPELIEQQEELYVTQPVDRGDIENLYICSVKTKAEKTISETFEEGGKIARLYKNKGEHVKKGDLLAEIESIDYSQQLANQEYVIQERALDIKQAEAMIGQKDESRQKELKKQISDLQDEMKGLQKSLKMNKELLAEGLAAEEEVNGLQDQISSKQKDIDYLQDQIDHPDTSDTETKQINLEKAKVAYESAVQEKANLEEKINRSKIYAKCTGKIIFMTTKQEGDIIGKEEKVYDVAEDGDKILYCEDEKDLDKFTEGAKVTVEGDTKEHQAVAIETPDMVPLNERNKPDYVPRVYFRLVDKNDMDDFSGDMGIYKLKKVLEKAENVLRIPTNSILYLDGKAYVYLLDHDVRVQKPIEIGLSTTAYTEVRAGLKEGDLVIIEGR